MRGDDDGVERRAPAEPHQHDDQERQRREPLPAQDQHAVDGREPVRLERHHPVERRERDREAVREEPAAAEHLHAARELLIGRPVLFERPGVEEVRQRVPDEEVDRGAGEEERRVEIQVLVLQHFVVRDEIGVRPDVEMAHAERDRQEQDGHHRQRARRRADGPADHDAPGAARELVHHAERQAAERHAQAQHVRHQVRLHELPHVDERADERHGRAHGAGEEQPALQARELGNRDVGGLCERRHWILPLSEDGTSASVACSLSCSARR